MAGVEHKGFLGGREAGIADEVVSTTALHTAVERGVVAGVAVLVADAAHGLIWEGQAGLRDVAAGAPVVADTLWWVASMSKPMTGAAAMMLVDSGELDLDAPISTHLDEFGAATPQGKLTARQCLSHTSGLPFASAAELQHEGGKERFAGSKFAQYRETGDDSVYDGMSLQDAVASYAVEPLVSEPGTQFLYSNAGINIAGRLIEVISRQSFAEFMDSRLLGPLGMVDTTLWPSEQQLGRLAKGYASAEPPSAAGLREVAFPQLTAPFSDTGRGVAPSGGYFSTARDCMRFGRMVLRGGELGGRRYLSERAVAELTADQTGDVAAGYGLGWQLDPPGSAGAGGIGHGGAMGTELWIHPGSGRLTVLMVHQDGGYEADGGDLRRTTKMLGKAVDVSAL